MNVREGFIRAKLEKEKQKNDQDPSKRQIVEIDEDFWRDVRILYINLFDIYINLNYSILLIN